MHILHVAAEMLIDLPPQVMQDDWQSMSRKPAGVKADKMY